MANELFDQSEGIEALKALQATLNPPTQRKLSEQLGCSGGTISDLYSGKERVGVVLADTIEGVSEGAIPTELFGFIIKRSSKRKSR